MNELMKVDFKIDNPDAIKFIEEKVIKLEGINDTIIDQLRDTLAEGLEEGEAYAALSKRVEEVYGVAQTRARTIARTEISGSANGGRFLVMKKEGASQHEWVGTGDERERDTHRDEDESDPVDLGDEFPVTGLKFPGDPDGEVGEIVNCRCITLPFEDGQSRSKNAQLRTQWRAVVDQWFHIEKQYRGRLKNYFNEQKKMVLEELAKITE